MARGYMRDEIYRFAIVFYNEENVASSAHWIADIRMPKASAPGYNIFTSGMRVDIGGSTTNSLEVVTHPLGVQFTVNIPSDLIQSKKITGYEIVRCERTISDRTILMQGAVSCVCNYDNTNQLTAFPYLTYSTSHGMVSQIINMHMLLTLVVRMLMNISYLFHQKYVSIGQMHLK